jgi:hypothetical protein
VVDRIERLDSGWIHGMHGGSLRRESIPNFVRALREKPFAYEGKLLGRDPGRDRSGPTLTGWASAGSGDRFRLLATLSTAIECALA